MVEVEKRSALKVQTQSHHADPAFEVLESAFVSMAASAGQDVEPAGCASTDGQIRSGQESAVQVAFLTCSAAVEMACSAL